MGRALAAGRRAVPVVALLGVLTGMLGCEDLRNFHGTWAGDRVGDDAVRQGFDTAVSATLEIDDVDLQTLAGRLSTNDDRFARAVITPVRGVEADVLSTMTFDGAPARVFVSFADSTDGGGSALVIISLYSDDRIELRVLRGGPAPLYGIFSLRHTDG